MNGILSLKELKELLRNEKSLKIILIAGLFLIIIIAFSGFSTGKTEKNDKMFFDYTRQSEYEQALEKKLSSVLSEINGIGKIELFLGKVAKGNLSADLDYAVSKREDELGNMARNAVKMQKSLIELVEKDPLTGLYNRRSAEKKLKEAYRNKNIKNINMHLVIGDIDYFKSVNDTYGHEGGDVVLTGVSDLIKKHIRGKGFATRWGGEEFLLTYIDMDYDEVLSCVQKLLEEVRETQIPYQEEKISVTMTFGINKEESAGIEEMLREADEKLYEGKKSGRNRII